jgi:uncharacterized protein YjbI with pentapeptide repeats
LGLHFENCDAFGLSFSFEGCQLNLASFYNLKIRKTVFRDSQLQETDFSECDLMGAIFDDCDLAQTIFDQSNLEKVDFRTAYNYSIDPERNQVKKARFSLLGAAGLLDKYDIDIE